MNRNIFFFLCEQHVVRLINIFERKTHAHIHSTNKRQNQERLNQFNILFFSPIIELQIFPSLFKNECTNRMIFFLHFITSYALSNVIKIFDIVNLLTVSFLFSQKENPWKSTRSCVILDKLGSFLVDIPELFWLD